jgi:hypothetical protein
MRGAVAMRLYSLQTGDLSVNLGAFSTTQALRSLPARRSSRRAFSDVQDSRDSLRGLHRQRLRCESASNF